ncbi:type II toxin-antitoxin system VapC family toxin [Ferrovibrio sp. MS7]|uniref:type II toxin-antitoxin system VapC family toxin n=1 Tax=Ferrovibrio plantarum TaxID=3119164 RepID=UPI003136A119
MRYLLDTNILIHSMEDRLSPPAADILSNRDNELVVSLISLWEMTIKSALGKLTVPGDIDAELRNLDITTLSLERAHINEYANLPLLHRDPFDRMLVAQARVERLTLVTRDANMMRYDVKVMNA